MDELWADNVDPLLQALERLGIDPVEWAADHDFDVFYQEGGAGIVSIYLKEELDGIREDQLYFACGYLQATGNLTNRTWAEQIADHLAEIEKEKR